MNDRVPGSSASNPIIYGDYFIWICDSAEYTNITWAWIHRNCPFDENWAEGTELGRATSEMDAKKQIDMK